MFSLITMLGDACPVIHVVDVGAMWLGAERLAYKALFKAGIARVVGFEPVAAECEKLNALQLKDHSFLPYFVGDGSERTFHLTNYSMTSSLYPPNEKILKLFNQLNEFTTTIQTSRVQTKRLDDISEIVGADFIKCDVQGADLDMLKGAEGHLARTLVVQVEVEFLPLYEGQPLFADVDTYLRSQGFALHTFEDMTGRAMKPVVVNGSMDKPVHQLLWADAVYIRDFERFGNLEAEELLKLAVILHEVYGSFDIAQFALYHYDLKTQAGVWPEYMKQLTGQIPATTPAVS
jgi:FkbM family methyltransferase